MKFGKAFIRIILFQLRKGPTDYLLYSCKLTCNKQIASNLFTYLRNSQLPGKSPLMIYDVKIPSSDFLWCSFFLQDLFFFFFFFKKREVFCPTIATCRSTDDALTSISTTLYICISSRSPLTALHCISLHSLHC